MTTLAYLLLLLLLLAASATALDIAFESITCDQNLPAFAYNGDIQVTCDGSKRCSLGQSVLISGSLQYRGLSSSGAYNNTGYASADLKLVTLEYSLFKHLPFNFCGDWVSSTQNYNLECPTNGAYSFQIPYVLPWDNDDFTSWFATGWRGTSDLVIYSEPDSSTGTLLVDCELAWSTYMTESNEEGWATLPSAAQAAIALVAVAAFMCLCCTWLTCCRKRTNHVTDEEYAKEFRVLDDAEDKEQKAKTEKEEQAYRINVSMRNPDWGA